MAESLVKQKSYDFALRIIRLCMWLKEEKHFEIATQLLRAGTSIGANVEEALARQSRKDFLAKMSLASKEARETNYWLRLIRDSGILNGDRIQAITDESEELCKILTSMVKTGNAKMKSASTQNSKLKTKN
ncbi:MAG TPA: four helix bundle protein [Planctomycetes bacterium]|nr:four helix bundle protein [Planctomycetota bacterium]